MSRACSAGGRRSRGRLGGAAGALAIAAAVSPFVCADSITLDADRDGTLIQPDGSDEYSLGSAWQFYAGRVGPNANNTLRRGLLRFPVESSVPPGSTITSVTINLYMSKTQTGNQNISFRRCTSDWGEGLSIAFGGGGAGPETNDVTWSKRFYPAVSWTTPGGDFVASPSVTKSVGGVGPYTFGSTAGLVSDVQSWVNGSQPNHGWAIIGNEVTLKSVKRFESRHTNAIEWRPKMVINFVPPSPGDVNLDGKVDGGDVTLVLGSWGACGECAADVTNDGAVDGADIAFVLGYWTPLAASEE